MKNKNLKYYLIVWSISLVAFNLITFLIPNEIMGVIRFSNPTFWISYALITISFMVQLFCSCKMLTETNNQKKFLKLPTIVVSFLMIGVTVFIGLIFMNIPIIPSWIGAIICILLMVVYVIVLISSFATETNIENINNKTKQKISFMKNLLTKIEVLINKTYSENLKKELTKLYDEIKFSDFVSNPELNEIENEIMITLNQIEESIKDRKTEELIIEKCHVLSKQIVERNVLNKNYK